MINHYINKMPPNNKRMCDLDSYKYRRQCLLHEFADGAEDMESFRYDYLYLIADVEDEIEYQGLWVTNDLLLLLETLNNDYLKMELDLLDPQ